MTGWIILIWMLASFGAGMFFGSFMAFSAMMEGDGGGEC